MPLVPWLGGGSNGSTGYQGFNGTFGYGLGYYWNGTNGSNGSNSSLNGEVGGLLVQHFMLIACLGTAALLAVGYLLIPGEKKTQFSEKPWSWVARTISLPLVWKFGFYSMPWTGYLFGGCFYSSINGLAAFAALAPSCLPQWLDLMNAPVPEMMKKGIGPSWKLFTALGSTAGSGVSVALFYGTKECSSLFFHLNLWLCVVSALFGIAWWKGEGGGVMGALASVRG